MCLLCEAGSLGSILAPLIGIGAAMVIVKYENKIKGFFSRKKCTKNCCPCKAKKP